MAAGDEHKLQVTGGTILVFLYSWRHAHTSLTCIFGLESEGLLEMRVLLITLIEVLVHRLEYFAQILLVEEFGRSCLILKHEHITLGLVSRPSLLVSTI